MEPASAACDPECAPRQHGRIERHIGRRRVARSRTDAGTPRPCRHSPRPDAPAHCRRHHQPSKPIARNWLRVLAGSGPVTRSNTPMPAAQCLDQCAARALSQRCPCTFVQDHQVEPGEVCAVQRDRRVAQLHAAAHADLRMHGQAGVGGPATQVLPAPDSARRPAAARAAAHRRSPATAGRAISTSCRFASRSRSLNTDQPGRAGGCARA